MCGPGSLVHRAGDGGRDAGAFRGALRHDYTTPAGRQPRRRGPEAPARTHAHGLLRLAFLRGYTMSNTAEPASLPASACTAARAERRKTNRGRECRRAGRSSVSSSLDLWGLNLPEIRTPCPCRRRRTCSELQFSTSDYSTSTAITMGLLTTHCSTALNVASRPDTVCLASAGWQCLYESARYSCQFKSQTPNIRHQNPHCCRCSLFQHRR